MLSYLIRPWNIQAWVDMAMPSIPGATCSNWLALGVLPLEPTGRDIFILEFRLELIGLNTMLIVYTGSIAGPCFPRIGSFFLCHFRQRTEDRSRP
jgi:hypothetical protein